MNIDKIIQKMHEGIILLEYTSLNSGTQKKREVTTNRKYIPEEKDPFKKGWTQTAESPKIICFDLDMGRLAAAAAAAQRFARSDLGELGSKESLI